MTALQIILGVLLAVILIIVILLHFSVKAYIEADKKSFDLVVKYLGFTVYKTHFPDKEKQGDTKDPEKNDSSEFELSEIPEVDSTDEPKPNEEAAEKADIESSTKESDSEEKQENTDEPEGDEHSASVLEKFNVIKQYIPAGKKAFRKLLKLFRFDGLCFELTVGSDDPYKAGVNFGRISAVFYNILALLCCVFSVKIDHTDIKCDFEHKTTDFYFKTALYVRPSAIISLLVYIGVYYFIIKAKLKKADEKASENIKKEKELSNE